MSPQNPIPIKLDINNPVFQNQLFNLPKEGQVGVLGSLKKLVGMTWNQVYTDHGLKWEAIHSRKGPCGGRLYTFRISKGFRAIAYREDAWLRILSLHPDHDAAYQ